MNLNCIYVLIFGLVCCCSVAIGDATTYDWTLRKNQNGIKVYTRPLKGYSYDQVMVVNKVRSSLSGIVGLLLDTKNYPNWMSGCASTSRLKTMRENDFYNYQVTSLPWPLSDRDVVSRFTVTQDSVSGIVTFSKIGEPNYIPEKDGMVRVQNFRSITTLTPLDNDSVQMVLELHLDPGGNVPVWFYNEQLINSPYNTTIETMKQLPKYQASSYSFIKEF